MNTTSIVLIIIAVIVVGYALSRRKKHDSGGPKVKPPNTGHDGDDNTAPGPNPGKPTPPDEPDPPPESPTVLIDRNGKRPGDTGYDPRVDRPADQFGPVEPVGAYYAEGPFDPDARWVGPDGVHWTDRNGVHHGP